MIKINQIYRAGFLALFLLMVFSCKPGKEVSSQNQKKFRQENPLFSSKFENRVKGLYKEKGILGDFILAVVDENGLAYSFAFNREVSGGGKSPLHTGSPIYIASATKAFTGTLLKILEERKILDLNRSLNDYLPQLTYDNGVDTKKISVKDLLNHTHGTFSTRMTWKTAYLGYGGKNEELIHDLNSDFLFDPSGKFRYSNVGPVIAGMVVESTTGKTWKTQMKDCIFAPLKMENTSADVSDFNPENIRPLLTISGKQGVVAQGFYKKDITMHAAGGIISTVNDLSGWLSANIRKDTVLLDKKNWTELHAPTTAQDKEYFTYHRSGYSLGWDIAEYHGERILTRFGGLAGISFHMSFIPAKKIGIIAFSNDSRAYLLPHLMANYAYNLVRSMPADSIFKSEKPKFDESFKKEDEISYPTGLQLLVGSRGNDDITGTYKNSEGWPVISIKKKENRYLFEWGILNGKVYKNKKGDGYSTHLGVLTRDFEIRGDTLLTGSLVYKKVAE